MSQESQKSQEMGSGNTKTPSKRSRNWCFTLNNYSEDEYIKTKEFCDLLCKNYRIGKEKGEKGTPHLQGFFQFKNQITFKSLKKKLSQISQGFHIEKMKGSIKDNIKYCEKEGNSVKPLTFKEKIIEDILNNEYNNVIWKKWQQDILDILDEKPDNRKINFIVDIEGNKGKSYLAKYIIMKKKGVIIADGKKDNIFNQICQSIENEIVPKIIILDVPRYNIEYLNYGCIEQIKNGFIYSGKYEGGQCIFPIPHVFIFMNTSPETHKLSKDRFNIVSV